MRFDHTRLRQCRKDFGLTQEELAVKADVRLNTVNRLENGRTPNPRIDTVVKVAEALGRDVGFFTSMTTGPANGYR